MPLQAHKQRIRDAFDRAASSYDGAAEVQRRICLRLIDFAQNPHTGPDMRILDAGCGTGFAARLLRARWPDARLTGVDFAAAMAAAASPAFDRVLTADIERLPLADRAFDLWWSSLSIQWCDPQAVFREAARVLAPGGHLAFSTLGTETFAELRSAFADIDRNSHTLDFSPVDALRAALEQAGLHDIRLHRERHTAYYPDLKSLLRAIKDIGAHQVGAGKRTGMLGRTAWLRLEGAYERFREPPGLPASYDVILGEARK